jgi:hypothetical protein
VHHPGEKRPPNQPTRLVVVTILESYAARESCVGQAEELDALMPSACSEFYCDVHQEPVAFELNARWREPISDSRTCYAHVPSGRPVRTSNLAGSPRSVSFLPRTTPQRLRQP